MKSKDKKRKRKVVSPWYAAWEGSDFNALTGTSKLDSCGFSPLHYACINGQLDAVVYLIDVLKADPNIIDKNELGWTPLHYAARKGDVTIMSNLIRHGADPEVKDKDGFTPIDVLCTTFGLPRPQRLKPSSGFDALKAAHPKLTFEDNNDNDDDDDTPKAKTKARSRSTHGIAELYSWGEGSAFQLGHGTQDSKPKPRKIRALGGIGVNAVSASRTHVLALTDTGKVYSWGSGGGGGKLGFGDNTSVVMLPEPLGETLFGGRRIVAIAAGNAYSGFSTDAGHVYVCGNGTLAPKRLVVLKEDPPPRFGQVSVGDTHVVALSTAGRVYSWSSGGSPSAASGPVLSPVPGIENVKMAMVCSGAAHAAAVSTGGKLYVWNYSRGGSAGKPAQVQVTEDRDLPEEGFQMALCHRKVRPQKAVSVVHATAEGSLTTAVSASGKIYVVDAADKDPIQIPFGRKSAKEAWLNAAGLYAVTRTGALNFVPREPIDTYLRVTRSSDDDEDYWVVYGAHAGDAVPYPTTLLYQVGVFAAGPSCAFATVPAPEPVVFDGAVQSTFAESMQSIAASGLYSDITLCTADGTVAVPAHRLLMSRCSNFAELESGARVVTAATTEAELRDFMLLVYTDTCLNAEAAKNIAREHGFCANPPVRKHLRQMYQKKCYADVTLSCPGMKDGTFPAHKAVLCARSEYFSAMLGSGMAESQAPVIELHEVMPGVLGHLLNYLYSDELNFASAKLSVKLDTLVAADEFLVPSMCDAAIRGISGDINADTIMEIADVAAGYRFHKLQELCTKFLVANPISLVCTSVLFELDGFIRDEVLAVSYQKAMAAEQMSKKAYYRVVVPPPSSAKLSPSELGLEEDNGDDDDDDDGNAGNTVNVMVEALAPGERKKMNSRKRRQLQKKMEREQKEREEAERKKEQEELTFWDEVNKPEPSSTSNQSPPPPPPPQSQSSISGVEDDEPSNVKIKIIRPPSKGTKNVHIGTDDILEFIDPQEAEKRKKKTSPPKQQSAWKTLPKVNPTAPIVTPNIPVKKQTVSKASNTSKITSTTSSTTIIEEKEEDNPYQAKGFQFNLADAIDISTKKTKSKQQQKKQQQKQQPAWGGLAKKKANMSEPVKTLEEIQAEELAKTRSKQIPSKWGSVIASGDSKVKSLDEIMNAELKSKKKK